MNGNGRVEWGDIKEYHNFIRFDFLLAYEDEKRFGAVGVLVFQFSIVFAMYLILFHLADNVVSNKKDKIEEKHNIIAVLQQYGYSKEFIQGTVKKHNRRKEQARKRPEEDSKQTKSINLPYIQGVSEQLKRTLNKHNFKATFYILTTLRSLLWNLDDPMPKEDRDNAVHVKIAKLSTWEKQIDNKIWRFHHSHQICKYKESHYIALPEIQCWLWLGT